MAYDDLDYRCTTHEAPTGTGTQTIDTQLGIAPTAIIIKVGPVDQPPDTWSVNMAVGVGFCDSALSQGAGGIYWESSNSVTNFGSAVNTTDLIINIPDDAGNPAVTAYVSAIYDDGTFDLVWLNVSGVAFGFGVVALKGCNTQVSRFHLPTYHNYHTETTPFEPTALFTIGTVYDIANEYASIGYNVCGYDSETPSSQLVSGCGINMRRQGGIFGSPGAWTGVELNKGIEGYHSATSSIYGNYNFTLTGSGFYAYSNDNNPFGILPYVCYLVIDGGDTDLRGAEFSAQPYIHNDDNTIAWIKEPLLLNSIDRDGFYHQLGINTRWLNRVTNGWLDQHGSKFSITFSATTDYLSISTQCGSKFSTVDIRDYDMAGYNPGTGSSYDGNPISPAEVKPYDYDFDIVPAEYNPSTSFAYSGDYYNVGHWSEAVTSANIDTLPDVMLTIFVPIRDEFVPQIFRRVLQ